MSDRRTLQNLRERKAELAKQARNILDKNPQSLPKDAQDEIDAIYSQIDEVQAGIDRWEKALQIENSLDTKARRLADQNGLSVDEAAEQVKTTTRAFNAWLAKGVSGLTPDQRKVLNISESTAATDAALVPTTIMPNAIAALKAYGGMRNVAKQISTANGNPIQWATYDDTANSGEWVAENQPPANPGAGVNPADILFGHTTINAYKMASGVIPVSIEILQDSAVAVEPIVNDALMIRTARGHNAAFTNGDGAGKPTGILQTAAVGYVAPAGNTASLAYDFLVELEHAIDPAYRRLASVGWMFSDSTLKIIKKLKDGNGRPLWLPSTESALDTQSDPGSIMGYRYTINQDFPALAASSKSIAFGAFEKYLIRDVMEMQIFRFTDSIYVTKGQIGFMVWSRTDGRQIDATNTAIKVLQQSAA